MDGVDSKGRIRELYNLKEDIGEQQNVVDKYPEVAERLRKMMDSFNEEFNRNIRESRK